MKRLMTVLLASAVISSALGMAFYGCGKENEPTYSTIVGATS